MQLLFFGPLQDLAGAAAIDIVPLPGETVAALALRLVDGEAHDVARLLGPRVRILADGRVVDGDALLDDVAELAFLPPVSGG